MRRTCVTCCSPRFCPKPHVSYPVCGSSCGCAYVPSMFAPSWYRSGSGSALAVAGLQPARLPVELPLLSKRFWHVQAAVGGRLRITRAAGEGPPSRPPGPPPQPAARAAAPSVVVRLAQPQAEPLQMQGMPARAPAARAGNTAPQSRGPPLGPARMPSMPEPGAGPAALWLAVARAQCGYVGVLHNVHVCLVC